MIQGAHPTPLSRQRLPARARVTFAALIVNACANILPLGIHLHDDGRLIVPLLVISLLVVLGAGLVGRGIGWAPLVAGLVALATTVADIAQPENASALLHPGANAGHFGNLVVLLVSALVALVVGMAAMPGPARRLTAPLS